MSKAKNLQHVGERMAVSLKALVLVSVIGAVSFVFVSFAGPRIVAPNEPAAMMAESFLAANRLPPAPSLAASAIETSDIAATCAGSMDASGDECDNGLEPTPTLTAAAKPSLDKRAGPALAKVGEPIVKPLKTAKSAAEQPNPENLIVGCAGGMDATGSDCK